MNEKTMSINDIKKGSIASSDDLNNMKPVNPGDIKAYSNPEAEIRSKNQEEIISNSLNTAIDRIKNKSIEYRREVYAQEEESKFTDDEYEDEDIETGIKFNSNNNVQTHPNDNIVIDKNINIKNNDEGEIEMEEREIKKVAIESKPQINIIDTEEVAEDIKEEKVIEQAKPSVVVSNNNLDVDDDDFDLDDEDKKEEEEFNQIKNSLKQKIKPINNKIDLTSFSVAKPVTVSSVLHAIQPEGKYVADWVLEASEKLITMEEFSGAEIQDLDPRYSRLSPWNTYTNIYGKILEHLKNENKPATVEQWSKLTRFVDLDHYYFSIYLSSLGRSNLIPYQCTSKECKKLFVKEVTPEALVKYKDEAAKKYIQNILKTKTSTFQTKYYAERQQISDDIVVDFKEPSVHDVIFCSLVLNDAFREKYDKIISITTYIDNMYFINRETNELRPIEIKEYPDNLAKTVKAKIKKYASIINTLNSDQYTQFDAIINNLEEKRDLIQYILPEQVCPHCGKVIPETKMTAEGLLFTRHQLGALVNLPSK